MNSEDILEVLRNKLIACLHFIIAKSVFIYIYMCVCVCVCVCVCITKLEGPGIESRWGARFSTPFHTCSEAHPASYTMGTWSFPVVKRPKLGVEHPPHLAPRLKKE